MPEGAASHAESFDGGIEVLYFRGMNYLEFNQYLSYLGLKQVDAAALLGVTPRALRRWQSGEQKIPAPVAELVNVWRQLHYAQLPWGADLESIRHVDAEQIRRHQEHDKALGTILRRVEARGGVKEPWRVNLKEHSAAIDSILVTFYKLCNGGFSLGHYRRLDDESASYRDQLLIEEAIVAFASYVAKARTERPSQEWDD